MTEGKHLTALVKNPSSKTGGLSIMEHDKYNNKKDYKRDLIANGYTVKGIYDDKDSYIRSYSDYPSFAAIKKKLQWYKQLQGENPNSTAFQNEIQELQRLIDEANKI